MPDERTREPALLALAALCMIAVGAYQLFLLATSVLARLAELPAQLARSAAGL